MNTPFDLARTLLATKLNPPTTTSSEVKRTGICQLVSASQSVKLILIRAPAGFGKTTAMVQSRALLEANGFDTAWMTIDSADNDASRFLACLAAAIAEMTEGRSAAGTETRFQSSPSALGDIALDIMERLATHTSPFALFLDDFELVQEPTVLQLVREIMEHLPRRGQLIIGSRGLPDIGIGRLRARGQLLEIDATQLRFSMEETVEFFTQRRLLALPHEDLSQLHRKTEGWVAALWLASVALERRDGRSEFIARFSGSNRAVAEYLAEDVLGRQPGHIRDFLLRTSILRDLNEALCNTLLPETDSAAILRHLEASNLFLIPIDGQERTYRYHSLFAGFLRAQLALELPEEVTRLHRAASRWYESQGRVVPAIDHALESRNFEYAVALLEQHAENLLEDGRMRLLARWFSAIPENYLRSSALLQAIHVWAICLTRGSWEAMALLECSDCANTSDPKVLAHVLALRPILLVIMDRKEEAYEAGREALARLPISNAFAYSALANAMAYVVSVLGLYQESHKLLDAARRGQANHARNFNKMYSESIEGLIDLEEGQLRQATARFRMAVNSTHAVSHTLTGGNAWAGVLYAGSLYEAGDLDQAEHLLHVYVPLAKDVGLADHIIVGYTMLSRIAFYRGDIDHTFHCLAELEYIGHHRQLPRLVASAKLERARTLLMQGNHQASTEELQRANNREVWERVQRLRLPAHDLEYLALGQLRWDVFAGDANHALPGLASAIGMATEEKRYRRALKLRLLQSLALKQKGDLRAAIESIGEVLKVTCREGFVRLIVDEGENAGMLVRSLRDKLSEKSVGRSDPIFSEYLQRLLEAFGPLLPADAGIPTANGNDGLVEPLTAKEIRMLLLLAEGYSNSALAEKLFVSDSTVRTHLRHINGKLNAQSRTQAVSIARRLGLIR